MKYNKYIDDDRTLVYEKDEYGLIAQELLSAIPEAVDMPKDHDPESPGVLCINYNTVTLELINGVKELATDADEKDWRITGLESELKDTKNQLAIASEEIRNLK